MTTVKKELCITLPGSIGFGVISMNLAGPCNGILPPLSGNIKAKGYIEGFLVLPFVPMFTAVPNLRNRSQIGTSGVCFVHSPYQKTKRISLVVY